MAKSKADFTANVKRQTAAEQLLNAAQDVQETTPARKERKTYSAQEVQEAQEALKTQGLKGVKLPRINLAFTPSNYDYIKTMAGVRGENLTEFVNHIIAQSMQENADLYEQAKKFKKSL